MDVIKLLEYLKEIIETGNKIPMTNKAVIDRSEALKTIDDLIDCLPEEFKRAKWVMDEKERILGEAIKESELMKKENMDMLKKQIENHNITKEAQTRAEQIIASAQKDAKAMRLGAREYANEILVQLDSEVAAKGADMVNKVKNDVDTFITALQSDVSATTGTIKDNITELKGMK